MKKEITINWINFQFKKFEPCFNGKTSIYSLYDRPSSEKVKIFNEYNQKLDWITWLTGSKFKFCIYWYVFDNENKKYYVKITPSKDIIMNS